MPPVLGVIACGLLRDNTGSPKQLAVRPCILQLLLPRSDYVWLESSRYQSGPYLGSYRNATAEDKLELGKNGGLNALGPLITTSAYEGRTLGTGGPRWPVWWQVRPFQIFQIPKRLKWFGRGPYKWWFCLWFPARCLYWREQWPRSLPWHGVNLSFWIINGSWLTDCRKYIRDHDWLSIAIEMDREWLQYFLCISAIPNLVYRIEVPKVVDIRILKQQTKV